MPSQADRDSREKNLIAQTVLDLLATQSPSTITPLHIARASGLPPETVACHCEKIDDALPLVIERISCEWRKALPARDPALSPSEALFDSLMTRFDVMATSRAGLCALVDYARARPRAALLVAKSILHALREAAAYAGLGRKPDSLSFFILLFHYGLTFEVWRRDDSQDKAATMARLDRSVKKFAALGGRF